MRDGFIGPHVRIPSGVGGLDEMLAGGLLPGRPYLIVGPPGSGKTTLALQFLLQGAKRGENVLYVTLEEPPNELKEDFKSLPEAIKNIWVFDAIPDVMRYEKAPFKDIAAVRAARRLADIPRGVRQTDEFRSVEIAFSALMQTLKMETAKRFYTRVVVDSLTSLKYFCMKGFDDATGAQVFLRFIAEMKITALLLVESPEDDAQLPERMLARGEIHLYNWESDRRMIRAIGIEKFRGSPHDNNLHPYRIASHGIAVDTTVSISKETREILPLPPSIESLAAKPSESELVLEAEWALMALLEDVRELLEQGIDAEPVRELVQQAHTELSEMRVQDALALLLEAREKVNHLILVNQVSEEYLQKYAVLPRVRQTSLEKPGAPATQLDPKVGEEARSSLSPLLDRLQGMLTTPQGKAMAENLTPSLLERAREKILAANASKISPVAAVEDTMARPAPFIPAPSRPVGPMSATRVGEAPMGPQRPAGASGSTALELGSKGPEDVGKEISSTAAPRPDALRTPSQAIPPISPPPEEIRKNPEEVAFRPADLPQKAPATPAPQPARAPQETPMRVPQAVGSVRVSSPGPTPLPATRGPAPGTPETSKAPLAPVPSVAPPKPSSSPPGAAVAVPRNPSQGDKPPVPGPKAEVQPQPTRPATPVVTAPSPAVTERPLPGELERQRPPSKVTPAFPDLRPGPSSPRVEPGLAPARASPPSSSPNPSPSTPPPMVRPGPAPTMVRGDAVLSKGSGSTAPPSGPVRDVPGAQGRKETLITPSVTKPAAATAVAGAQAPATKPEALRAPTEPEIRNPAEASRTVPPSAASAAVPKPSAPPLESKPGPRVGTPPITPVKETAAPPPQTVARVVPEEGSVTRPAATSPVETRSDLLSGILTPIAVKVPLTATKPPTAPLEPEERPVAKPVEPVRVEAREMAQVETPTPGLAKAESAREVEPKAPTEPKERPVAEPPVMPSEPERQGVPVTSSPSPSPSANAETQKPEPSLPVEGPQGKESKASRETEAAPTPPQAPTRIETPAPRIEPQTPSEPPSSVPIPTLPPSTGPTVETPPTAKPTGRKGTRAPSKPRARKVVAAPPVGGEIPTGTAPAVSEVPPLPARKRGSSRTAGGAPRAPRKPAAHPRKVHPKSSEAVEDPPKEAATAETPPAVTENTSGGDSHETT